MQYNTLGFLLFLLVLVLIYYKIPLVLQKYVLLIANISFYLFYGFYQFILFFITISVVFISGKKLGRSFQNEELMQYDDTDRENRKAENKIVRKKRKHILRLAFLWLLGTLICCKYLNFIINNLNYILSFFNTAVNPLSILMPVGISFYTFMLIGYLLDVYWKRIPAENNFLRFLLVFTYFPHIVQGPIGRYDRLAGQTYAGKRFDEKNFSYGTQLIIWGFFKKLVIADRINIFVSGVFDNWSEYTGLVFAVAAILYSFQIYADFSGCIDIVRGASQIMGIHLDINFRQPYLSKTMPEFWRRWHISLNKWFRDYLYYPISTSKFTKKISSKIKVRWEIKYSKLFTSCFSTLIVWLVTGIWHGAEWKYVVWGIFHAALITGSILFETNSKKLIYKLKINSNSFSWRLYQILRTFTLCCIGRIFFRAENLTAAIEIIKRGSLKFDVWTLFNGELFNYGLDYADFLVMCISIALLIFVDILKERFEIRVIINRQNLLFRWLIIYASIAAVIVFGIYGPEYNAASFIYNQF